MRTNREQVPNRPAARRSGRATWPLIVGTVVAALLLPARPAGAQSDSTVGTARSDTTAERRPAPTALRAVTIRATRPVGAVGTLPDVQGASVFAARRTEVLYLDSLTANRAQTVAREVVGRIPGATFSETEGSGFPASGIGVRGLNPVQSVEMNVRQDGTNIAADVYGYPETYYLPPLEAVERVEVVRGAAALQFGPQVGGLLNYVLRSGAADTPARWTAHQTVGSGGLAASYAAVQGGTRRAAYFGFAQYRRQDGWRPNGALRQFSAAARVGYAATPRLRLRAEYSLLRNRIQMPGGLTDAAFAADPRQSLRARNWLESPWNVGAVSAELTISPATRVVTTVSLLDAARSLVWRNEDGGAGALDLPDPATGAYTPREVESERARSATLETRLITTFQMRGLPQTLATGVRAFTGTLARDEGGTGTTGRNFDLSLTTPGGYPERYRFFSRNLAAFAEQVVRLTDRLSLTPGARVELLRSGGGGHDGDARATFRTRDRAFALLGIGAQYRTAPGASVYANVSQSYRPIDYSYLVPFGSATRVAPGLRDPRATTADVGFRGTLAGLLTVDVGAFRLVYRDRIALVSGVGPAGAPFTERRNAGTSVHRGVEAYAELRSLNRALRLPTRWGTAGLYDAFGYVDARYTTGAFAGHRVEFAPRTVNRLGVTYGLGRVASTLQWSSVARQFSDANNTVASPDASIGVVPAYHVADWSGRWRLTPTLALGFGVNNLANAHYFTLRTGEYPGPGIIPSPGRSAYLSVALTPGA